MTVSFNKSRQRWTYDFRLNGFRHQGYCMGADGQPVTSKSAAKQAEGVARRMAEIAPKLPTGGSISLMEVLADLVPAWKLEKEWPNKERNAREIVRFFGAETPITAITLDQIHRYIVFCQSQPIMVWRGARSIDPNSPDAARFWKDTGKKRTPATVNRRLATLRQIIDHASIMRDPLTQELILPNPPKFSDLPEPKRRARPTPEPVMQRLGEILPPHATDAMVITLCFGFRGSEAFSLQEHQVDWHADGVRLFSGRVKDKKDVFLPGSQFAMGYLRCLAMEADERRDAKGKPLRHLISYRRASEPWRPIKKARSAWKTAMRKIETEFGGRWRWHDLRAAFITHIAMTCGPLAAQQFARHADFDTTRGYIEVADEMMRVAAERAAERPALRLVGTGKTS